MNYKDYSNIRERKVGPESARTFIDKLDGGFWDKWCTGNGLDIGYIGKGTSDIEPILPTAIGIDTNYPNYDGIHLPFNTESQSFVYSSHCLEHIKNYKENIQEWFRVLKIGGHLVILVPHKHLYEKKNNLPSLFNEDHQRYYTPASLLNEIETSLEPNSYRVRLLEDGDKDYDYSITPTIHSNGQYEILLVIEKIHLPDWVLL